MIDNRLKKVMDITKTGIKLPIILEVRDMSASAMQELARAGVQVTKQSQFAKNVFGFASQPSIEAAAKLPFVANVFYDEPVHSLSVPLGYELGTLAIEKVTIIPIVDALAHVGVPDLWDEGLTGKGVKVGIIDTGISQQHPTFTGAIKGTYSAVPEEGVEDQNEHGSWCAGAAAGRPIVSNEGIHIEGAAPDADIYALKALSDEGSGSMSWVMDCIEHAVMDFNVDVISMSLGSLTDNAGIDPISKLVNQIVKDHNVIMCIAAGNSFVPGSIGSPGGAALALTVGAVAMQVPQPNVVSSFSSKGPTTGLLLKPDCAAPGGNVLAPGIAEMLYGASAHEGYASMAGTSMATPITAGCMALLRQAKPTLSREDLEKMLSLMSPFRPKDPMVGYGVIDMMKLYQNIDAPAPFLPFQTILGTLQSAVYLPNLLQQRESDDRVSAVRLPAYILE
jgi:subtilisin family serine protease